jgi:hypothetical protein
LATSFTHEQFIANNSRIISKLVTRFEGYQTKITFLRIDRFLSQFDNRDKHAALALLQYIDYYSNERTTNLVKRLGKKIRQTTNNNLESIYFCPTDDSTGSSTYTILGKLKNTLGLGSRRYKKKFIDVNKLEKFAIDLESKVAHLQSQIDAIRNLPPENQIYTNPQAQIGRLQSEIEKLRADPELNEKRTIIFVDDFIGSGTSFTTFLGGLTSWYNPSYKYYYAVLVAHQQGISKITELPIEVISATEPMPESKKIFSDANTFFTPEQKTILKKYCERLGLSKLFKYGFDNTQSNVIFYEKSSNNILPILNVKTKNWRHPLFPRKP